MYSSAAVIIIISTMVTEEEMAEYRSLCAACGQLHENYLKRKQELLLLLGELSARRREAFMVLEKANRLARRLSGRQRQISGFTFHSGEIKARLCRAEPVLSERETLPEIVNSYEVMPRGEMPGRLELKKSGIAILGMIDNIKKSLLQIDLLALRCRELILAIDKGMEAFRHEFAAIRRKIYPFGIFSVLYRYLRALGGGAYFSFRDMEDMTALGSVTGDVLKIADTPLYWAANN